MPSQDVLAYSVCDAVRFFSGEMLVEECVGFVTRGKCGAQCALSQKGRQREPCQSRTGRGKRPFLRKADALEQQFCLVGCAIFQVACSPHSALREVAP